MSDSQHPVSRVYVGVKPTSSERLTNDFYPTAPIATYALVRALGEDLPHNLLEPCAGRGNISVELERCGRSVKSFDLYSYDRLLAPVTSGVSFLDLPKQDCDGVVTNPPFFKNYPLLFAEKAKREYDFVAFFVRLTFLEGKARSVLFDDTLSDMIFLSDRIRFREGMIESVSLEDQIGGIIAYAWVVWNKRKRHENVRCQWVTLSKLYPEWRAHYDITRSGETFPTVINSAEDITSFMMS